MESYNYRDDVKKLITGHCPVRWVGGSRRGPNVLLSESVLHGSLDILLGSYQVASWHWVATPSVYQEKIKTNDTQ